MVRGDKSSRVFSAVGMPVSSPSSEISVIWGFLRSVLPHLIAGLQQVDVLEYFPTKTRLLVLSDGVQLLLKSPPDDPLGDMSLGSSIIRREATVLSVLAADALPIPACLSYDRQTETLLTSHIGGTSLLELQPYLTYTERARIDGHIGAFIRSVTSHTYPFFGPVSNATSNSWRRTFMDLLGNVLDAAGDMTLGLPCEQIRDEANYFSPFLDEVRGSRLVLPSAGGPESVLLDASTREVRGFMGFGDAVYGDPFLTEMLHEPSTALLDGFGSPWSEGTLQGQSVRRLL